MESRELDVGPEDREGGGPVAELVDDDQHQGGYAELVKPLGAVDDVIESLLVTGSAVVERPVVFNTDGRLIDRTYEDQEGRWWKVRIPEGADMPVSMGIPVGPPDLSELDLPHSVMVRLHNQLFNRGLFSRADLRGRGREVHAALQAAYRVDAIAVTALYR